MKIIKFENVTKFYKEKASLNSVSFEINSGEFHALIGKNGAGKSTLIKTIIFGNKINDGAIFINGKNYLDASSKIGIGYVPDKLELSTFITVKKFLMRFYLLSGFSRQEAKSNMLEKLSKYKLEKKLNSRFKSLSMGEQKKIILIQSLINDPSFLILDEPTTNLDAFSEQDLFKELKSMNEKGTTILIVSHRLDLIEKYASNITVLESGKLLYTGKNKTNLINFLDKKIGGENE